MAEIHSINAALSILDETLANSSPENILQHLRLTFVRIERASASELIVAAQTLRAIADADKRMRKHAGLLSLANAVRLRMQYLVLDAEDAGDSNARLLEIRLQQAWGYKRALVGEDLHSLSSDIKKL